MKILFLDKTVLDSDLNVFELSSFEGYDEMILNADKFESGTVTRNWLNTALAKAASSNKSHILFPKNKTFYISIPVKDTTAKKGGSGLVLNNNLTIDFNGSTIIANPTNYLCYRIIDILGHNVTIKNGTIIGERLNHTMSEVTVSDEWCYGVFLGAVDNCTIENMDISETRGDGINIEGICYWNHPDKYPKYNASESTKVLINSSGVEESSTTWVTSTKYFTISTYLYESDCTLCIHAKGTWVNSYGNYISYYDSEKNFIGREYVKLGYGFNIPENAVYFRISISPVNCDNFIANNEALWIMTLHAAKNVLIKNCEIHHCGRNGVVPTVTQNFRMENTTVSHIWGTNNRVCVDIEGTSYVLHGYTFENCIFDLRVPAGETAESSVLNGLILALGNDVTLKNCIFFNCGYSTGGLESFLDGCSFYGGDIHIRNNYKYYNSTSGTTSEYSAVKTFMRASHVKNCYVEGACSVLNGVVENCTIKTGTIMPSNGTTPNYYNGVYKDCYINGGGGAYLAGKLFDNCYLTGFGYINGTNDNNVVKLVNSTIKGNINGKDGAVSMEGCTLTGTHNNNVGFSLRIKDKFINNYVKCTSAGGAGQSGFIKLGSATSNVLYITGNTFIGTGCSAMAMYLSTVGTLVLPSKVYFENNRVEIDGNLKTTTTNADNGLIRIDNFTAPIYFRNNTLVANNPGRDIKFQSTDATCKVYREGNSLTGMTKLSSDLIFDSLLGRVGTVAPANPLTGYMYYNSTEGKLYICVKAKTDTNDAVWVSITNS